MQRYFIIVLPIFFLFLAAESRAATLIEAPKSVKQGGVIKIVIRSDVNLDYFVEYLFDHSSSVKGEQAIEIGNNAYLALLPVSVYENPGNAFFCVRYATGRQCLDVMIEKANFPVSKKLFRVFPLTGALEKRFSEEKKFLDSVYALQTAVRYFSDEVLFSYPIKNNMEDSAKGTYGVVRNKIISATKTNPKTLRWKDYHKGIDFSAFVGTEIFSAESGIVVASRDLLGSGKTVIIDHGVGLISLYFHLSKLNVKEGDVVKRGQKIALSGNTGYSQGPHLHFEVRLHKIPVDPFEFLKGAM